MMRTKLTLTIALIFSTFYLFSQIPNNSFEIWENKGNYLDPEGWKTLNNFAVVNYPVTRSTDHYPAGVGEYSMRIQNNTVSNSYGLVMATKDITMGPTPYFAVQGHPQSFTGYYRFVPQNGDSMMIVALLYKNGAVVSSASLIQNTAAPNWTAFNIPFSDYASADSASIILSAYYAVGPPPAFSPKGNSTLYIDNLSFDNTSVITEGEKTKMGLYPNPFGETMRLSHPVLTYTAVVICNHIGQEVYKTTLAPGMSLIELKQLEPGSYFIRIGDKILRMTKGE